MLDETMTGGYQRPFWFFFIQKFLQFQFVSYYVETASTWSLCLSQSCPHKIETIMSTQSCPHKIETRRWRHPYQYITFSTCVSLTLFSFKLIVEWQKPVWCVLPVAQCWVKPFNLVYSACVFNIYHHFHSESGAKVLIEPACCWVRLVNSTSVGAR